ncbi:variable large family protein (plasmid) [Borreliella finlandensis]|uniref:variable large family protein n=1 Tax=Borreliella finlandensis TaxID=498741 RepID=UPI003AEFDCE5
MIKAAGEAAAGSTGGGEKIGDAGGAKKGKEADASSVTGIAKGIKGIVDAAGKAITGKPGGDVLADVTAADDNKEAGKLFAGSAGAGDAADAAAIGTDGNGANFGNDEMKKSDKIAAAIVLRGLAKGGKFAAVAANSGKENVKSTVESAVGEVSGWLEEMIKAAEAAAAAGSTGGSGEKIGDTGAGDKKGGKRLMQAVLLGLLRE